MLSDHLGEMGDEGFFFGLPVNAMIWKRENGKI